MTGRSQGNAPGKPDPFASLPVPTRFAFVEGWGMASGAYARVVSPRSVEELQAVTALCGEHGIGMGLRGSGRSYGDASHTEQGVVIDGTGLNRILSFDTERGHIEVEGGVSIEQLWKYLLPKGHWPAVVPGTMAPTIAGMVSMNVHGKNQLKVGALGDQVLEFDLLLPSGEIRTVRREENEDLFRAVVGGLGLLGLITRVVLKTKRVHSGNVRVRGVTAPNLPSMMDTLVEYGESADYLVGWVDCFAKGATLGRGLSHIATHLLEGEDPEPEKTLQVAKQELPGSILGFPKAEVWRPLRVLNRDLGMRTLNRMKYFMGKRETKRGPYLQTHAGFNFLLDYVPNWKFAYGRRRGYGLIQYQPFVPKETAAEALSTILRMAQDKGLVSYLGVLKRHRPDDYLLTHSVDGWSLALDFKVNPGNRGRLWSLCDEMTGVILDAGGRFYPAKDLVLGAGAIQRSLPEADRQAFLRWKSELDPAGLLQNDQYRRLIEPLDGPGPLPLTDF